MSTATTTLAARLASDPGGLRDRYDIVIVGSGYGGAIMAARLAFANHRAGGQLRIALLERGDEHPTGTFPETTSGWVRALRTKRNPLGHWDIQPHDGIDIWQGNGLGGGSLINYNVALVPDREVFLESWPRAIRADVEQSADGVGELQEYFDRARRMLGAVGYTDRVRVPQQDAFERIAEHIGATVETSEQFVSLEDRVTLYGVQRRACTACGACGGCNVGAKNTLMTNYLPMAAHYGVELYTRLEVDTVLPDGEQGWRLACKQRAGHRGRDITERTISAGRVVLAAGTLGSTGIMLRSRAAGLDCSKQLGKNFSGNGDSGMFAYNTDYRTDSIGHGTQAGLRSEIKPGPVLPTLMKVGGDQRDLRKRITLEGGTFDAPMARIFKLALTAYAARAEGERTEAQGARRRRDLRFDPDGALNHSLVLAAMLHDSADGEIVLNNDGSVRVDWPHARQESVYSYAAEIIKPAVEAIGGVFLTSPRAERLLGGNLLSAHPLGGCAAADSADYGVVDHAGRVFDTVGGIHPGLYVSDGAVCPRGLGVNPSLTIAMFAERAAEHLREQLELPAYDHQAEGDDRASTPEPSLAS
jgi:cholesterol oxidase